MKLNNLGKVLTSRRKALGLFATATATAPLVAKQVADEAAAKFTQTSMGIPNGPFAYGDPGMIAGPPDHQNMMRGTLKTLLMDDGKRKELESLLYEQHRAVHFLDTDLANKRSFSLAAKITFQRQRNVERWKQDEANGTAWVRAFNYIKGAAKWLPI